MLANYFIFILVSLSMLIPTQSMAKDSQQTTNTVLMVQPNDFAYNPQTAVSNAFQNKPDMRDPRQHALREFAAMVKTLRDHDINVITLPSRQDIKTPDAVFPNNWFSTHLVDDKLLLVLYPMLTPNRQAEVRPDALLLELKRITQRPIEIYDLRQQNVGVLEGTGSLIFDRVNRLVYASLSPRTSKHAVEAVAKKLGYRPVLFHSYDQNHQLIYHTNVMMSVGSYYVVACLACIESKTERQALIKTIKATDKVLIDVTQDQITKMTGNILEVTTQSGQPAIVMSRTAYDHFTTAQRHQLAQLATLIPVDIPTIESIGGGSARCMLAEIFH